MHRSVECAEHSPARKYLVRAWHVSLSKGNSQMLSPWHLTGLFCRRLSLSFANAFCAGCWLLVLSTVPERLHFPDPHANRVLVLSPPIGDIPMRFGRWKRSRSHFRSLDIEQPGECWQVKVGGLAGASVHPSACELPTSGLQVAEIIGGGSSCNFYNCLIFWDYQQFSQPLLFQPFQIFFKHQVPCISPFLHGIP